MSTLSLKNINKIYENKVQAVFDFNLDIADKEFVVFVGPSGCGKSTTLRMVAGLEEITSGELYIDNKLMNRIDAADRDIAMVFQNYALYPHMTVFDNMAFALKLRLSYVPVYNEESLPQELTEELKLAQKNMLEAHKKWAIKKNDKQLENHFYELFEVYKSVIEKLKNSRTQKVGIDEYQIKKLTDSNELSNKEIVRLEKLLGFLNKDKENYLSKKEGLDSKLNDPSLDEKTQSRIKKDIDAYEKAIVRNKNEIESVTNQILTTKKEIELNTNRIEFLKVNEIPLFIHRKLTRDEIVAKVFDSAEILDLIPYLKRKPKALSGGQRQRVALGRAIVRNPKVFLMDEPLSNLDAKLRVQTRTEILRITRQIGATTIYVTHDQTEAMTMADRIVVMKDGYIQQIDTPENIYLHPVNTFVAGFIGNPAMNFIKGKIENKKFIAANDSSSFTLKLNKNLVEKTKDYEGKEIILGIRPEHIYLEDSKENAEFSEPFNLTCEISELLGNDLIVYSKIAGQTVLSKINAKSKISEHQSAKFKMDLNSVIFFDKETKKAL